MNLLQIPGLTTTVTDSIPTIKEETAMLKSLPFDELVDKLVNTMVTFAINLAIAIVVFLYRPTDNKQALQLRQLDF